MSASIAVRKGVAVFAVILIGMLAGILAGSGMDQLAVTRLPLAEWLAFRGSTAWVFPTTMPWIFNGTLLVLLIAAVLARGAARWLFAVAAVLCVAAILVTVRVEVPMNQMIGSWTPVEAPADWMAVRDHWLRMHLLRSVAGLLGFVAAVNGLTKMPVPVRA
jgi:hypothetical protein